MVDQRGNREGTRAVLQGWALGISLHVDALAQILHLPAMPMTCRLTETIILSKRNSHTHDLRAKGKLQWVSLTGWFCLSNGLGSCRSRTPAFAFHVMQSMNACYRMLRQLQLLLSGAVAKDNSCKLLGPRSECLNVWKQWSASRRL